MIMASGGTSIILFLALAIAYGLDPAAQQLNQYKKSHPIKNGSLITSNGVPVEAQDVDSSLGYKNLLNDEYFIDSITHLVRERIPERIVHTKGVAAHGYFEVTNDVANICKASFLSAVGKKTKVFVRFSPGRVEKGTPDATGDIRGFVVKFYTEEGNFDIVGLNLPVFSIKDPIKFDVFVHSRRKNPVTNLEDANISWDFATLNPETLFFLFITFAGRGIPYSYRNMPGFSIHTYQLVNKGGQCYFARFTFMPDLGVKNLTIEEALKLNGKNDSDYLTRDLYNAIAKGNFPSWTMYMQILSLQDIKNMSYNVFDVTRLLPTDKYPLRPIGRLVLNKNPENYFAEVEQSAFCPGNLVPGILGAPDKLFQARRFAYRDSQLYRLGVNFQKIPINCPFASKPNNYLRDGRPPVEINGGSSPNYYPNSFHGPTPRKRQKSDPKLIDIYETKPYNFDQVAHYVKTLTKIDFNTLIENISTDLCPALPFIQKRAIKLFSTINLELSERVKKRLQNLTRNNCMM